MGLLNKIVYRLHSGKNNKALFFAKGFVSDIIPHRSINVEKLLHQLDERPDRDEILSRVNYYCKAPSPAAALEAGKRIGDFHRKDCNSVYYFDIKEFTRGFGKNTKVNFLPGDIAYIPDISSLVKSRPVSGDNRNSVILKFNKLRHFIFVKDRIPWNEKIDKAVFRGKVRRKPLRMRFFEKCFGNPMLDLGEIDHRGNQLWLTPKMTIAQHLKYKFILSLEGNDVASNLKWVMSSGSVAVMTRPKFETWFMEGLLIPGKHYLEIADDFSDLEEKIQLLIKNPDMAMEIVRNAHEWVDKFRDPVKERLISRLTLAKYLGIIPPSRLEIKKG